MKNTKSVQKIMEAFSQKNTAFSGVELIKKFHAEMNKTTVYRILERLEKTGLLHSFTGKNGLKWYATSKNSTSDEHNENHSHFQCQDCGISKCLPIKVEVPAVPNHRVDSANIVLIGQCEECLP